MTFKTVQVLLVEDDDIDVMAVRRAFKREKIANPIVVARDGLEALEVLRGGAERPPLERPYIVLLDLNMPRMNGLEFLEALRGDPDLHDTVVFVMTTSSEDEDKLRAYAQHVAGYIVKRDVGSAFSELTTKLLQAYWRVVELPC